MALDAGAVYVRLGAVAERHGFDQWKRDVTVVKAEAKDAIKAELGADFDERGFARYERALEASKRQAAQQRAFKAHLGADYDDKAFKAYERDVSRAGASTKLFSRHNSEAARGLTSIQSRISLVRWGVVGAGAAYAATEVFRLGSALGPLIGLLGAIPSGVAVAAQGLGGLLLSVSGVGGAIKEAFQSQDKAATGAAAALDTHKAAQRGVESAARGLTDAERQQRFARDDLNRALAEARREMDDLYAASLRADLQQREATHAVVDARRELARLQGDPNASADDVTHAEFALEDARLRAREARTEAGRARADNARATRQGVRGNENVVSAQRAVDDASRGVADAQRELAQASEDASQAMGKQSAQADQLQQKLAHLSPAARDFVHFIAGMRPEFDKLRAAGAEELFPRVTRGIQDASKNLPVLRGLIAGAGREFGQFAERGGRMLGSKEWGRDLAAQGRENEVVMDRGGRALLFFADAARHVMRSAKPLTDWLSLGTLRFAKYTDEQAKAGRESGKLTKFFEHTTRVGTTVWHILRDTAAAIFNIGRASNDAAGGGDEMLHSLERGAASFRRWTGSARGQNALKGYFEAVREAGAAVWRQIGRIIDRYQELRREGKDAMDALAIAMGEAISRATEFALRHIGQQAPEIARAFVEGFLAANIWGKLLIGSWLLRRFGGRTAIKAVGSRIGALLGLEIAAGAAAGAAGGGAAGAAGGGGLLAALAKRFPRLARGGLLVGGTLAANEVLTTRGSKDFDLPTSDSGNLIDKTLRKFGMSSLNRRGGLFSGSPGKEDDDRLRRFGDTASATAKRLRELGDNEGLTRLASKARRLAREFPQYSKQLREFAGSLGARSSEAMARDLARIQSNFTGLRNGATSSLKDILVATRENMTLIARTMGVQSDRGQKEAARNFRLGLRAIQRSMRDGEVSTSEAMRAVRRLMRIHSGAGAEAVGENFTAAKNFIRRNMRDSQGVTAEGMRAIRRIMVEELKFYGLSDRQARNIAKTGDPDKNRGREGGAQAIIRARGGVLRRAVGGWIGRPGEAGGDDVPISARAGGSVWNRHQAPSLDMALAATGYGGIDGLVGGGAAPRRGNVRALVGRGELYLEPEGTSIADRALRAVGLGGAQALFDAIKTPHFMASGGIAGAVAAANRLERAHFPYRWGGGHQGSPAPFGPMDCSGAVSYVLQHAGVKIPTMVSGALAGAGKPGPGQITVFANPEHTFMRIGSRYFGTSGSNPGGGAGWFPDPGGGYKSRFAVRHFMAGEGGGGGSGRIPRVRITGPGGALTRTAQRALDVTRAGAQRRLDALSESVIGSGDAGDAGPVPGGWRGINSGAKFRPYWNKVNPDLKRFAATFADIVFRESRFDPHAGGPGTSNPGHAGWYQFDRPTWASFGAGSWPGGPYNPGRATQAAGNVVRREGRSGIFNRWQRWEHNTGGVLGAVQNVSEIMHLPKGRRARLPATRAKGKQVPVSTWGKRVAAMARARGAPRDIEGRLQALGNEYTRTERRGQLDDSEIVVNPGDEGYIRPRGAATDVPYIDQQALADRVEDMDRLLRIRRRAVQVWDRYATRVRDARRMLARAGASLRRRLRARGLTRAGRQRITAQIKALVRQDRGLAKEQRTTIAEGRQDAWLDFQELRNQRNELAPSAQREVAQALASASDGSDNADLQALLQQAEAARDTLQASMRAATSAFNVFAGSGDIGGGAQYALRAGAVPGAYEGAGPGTGYTMNAQGQLIGPGNVLQPAGSHPPTYGGGFAPQIGVPPGLYLARVDDVAGKDQVARLSNAGNAASGYVPSSSEGVGP